MIPLVSPGKSRLDAKKTIGLDAKAEYLDTDGVPRRSSTVTRRMIQRGHSINKASLLTDEDQLHTSRDERQKENEERNAAFLKEQEELKKKQDANAAFKVQTKAERLQWIIESNELIAARLELWYDATYAPKHDENVDVTEENTPVSPSKLQRFIDFGGNLRRKSNLDGLSSKASKLTTPERPHETHAANVVTKEDQVLNALDGLQKQSEERNADSLKELTEVEKTETALNRQTKAEPQQWSSESNEPIATSIDARNDNEHVPKDDGKVDVTEEQSTAQSPSKLPRCFGFGGMLRRKANAPPSSDAHSAYAAVATPPVSPGKPK